LVKTLMRTRHRSAVVATIVWLQIYAPELMAENEGVSWAGELYGGKYYDDSRVGLYLVSSAQWDNGATFIGEVLHENYTDYEFNGVGAHLLWPVSTFGDVGLVVSQAWESYEDGSNVDTDYQTRTLALEWELEQGQWAVAVQAGKYLKDYDGREPEYLSGDLYFWGNQHDWYLRGATRRISGASFNLFEGYRVFKLNAHAVTAYVGMSADDLSFDSPGKDDSVYAGTYAEVFSTPGATLSIWVEAAAEDNDTLFTIELNLAFGAGARTPYITAFGFSLDD